MNKNKLHPVQEQLLKLLSGNSDSAFTIREMQHALGVSSTSIIARHLTHLEKKGYIKRNPYCPRDYQVMHQGPEKSISVLNLYGLAQCGKKGELLTSNPIERIPIATTLLTFSASEAFLVKARGNSMLPRIRDGDFIIARKTTDVRNGMIAICINDDEVLIKKIQKTQKSLILVSLNPDYDPFIASEEQFRVVGEVKGVISKKI